MDAICIGEGEKVFPQFLKLLRDGKGFHSVDNFWVHNGDVVVKNPYHPLLTSGELDILPFPALGAGELIYQQGVGFRRLEIDDRLRFEALSYNTLWSRGCPFRCTYCGNTTLLELDRNYGQVRHSSVNHVVAEVEAALDVYPFISYVAFHDDCFISLPEDVLQEFADTWRTRIGLPFAVHGLTPAHVRKEKLAILMSGGLNRVRMGVQSGSNKLLKFYRRPNREGLVKEATDAIGKFAKHMVPPAYDIIVDNPIETRDDVAATLKLIQEIPRPFTLNIFSLRYIPGTELGRQLREIDVDIVGIERNYHAVMPTFANALLYLVAFVRLPDPVFKQLLKYAKPYKESSHRFGVLVALFKAAFLSRRAFQHIRCLDFSVVFGRAGYAFWQVGLVGNRRRKKAA